MHVGTILMALIVLSVPCACGPIGGIAGFWKGYRSDLIVNGMLRMRQVGE